ncbi:ribbon-helix-helix domain-containing protein [Sulfurisphaera ohwakuensis]|uniref:ribbon-helix-helix domain-containing protein n=1 Tax=Sulfurisphaera ohwakuensis TaxID=69656 RepID=UPI0036F2C746
MMLMATIRKVNETTFEIDLGEVKTISFKLEEDFLREIDEMTKMLGYSNRSDLIRDAIIEYIQYLKSIENEEKKKI